METGKSDTPLTAGVLSGPAVPKAAPNVTQKLGAYGRLILIWAAAGTLALVLWVALYTLVIGRDRTVYDQDVYEGYRLVGAPGTTQVYTWEGHGVTSYGQHGLVVAKTLDPDVPRLLFLGDSYVEAKQVSDAGKFTEIIQNTWNAANPDHAIQTLNLGMAGQDIRTYLSFGRNMDRQFAPSRVFVMLNQQDFLPLANDLDLLAQFQADPTVKLVKPEKLGGVQAIISDTPVRQFFLRALLQTDGFMAGSAETKAAQSELAGNTFDVLEGQDTAVVAQLRALRDIWGDRLVIVYNTYIPAFGKDAPPTYAPDTLMRAAEQLDIPLVNLYEPMLHAFQTQQPPRGFQNTTLGIGHFNEHGHQIIADQILAYLQQAGPGAPRPLEVTP